MKKIIAYISAFALIAAMSAGCGNGNAPPEEPEPEIPVFSFNGEGTAAEQLENLFTTIDLMDASISELSEEMAAGRVTSARLTQMYLDRIAAYDDSLNLNSVTNINPAARREAAELDVARAEGNIRGILHGIPVIIKDNIDVAGMATTAGSVAFADNVAEEDAFVVKKLREAGAVILGKANMSEFAVYAVYSSSTFGGDVHNAYDTAKTSGGSSGGTAVAVSANFAAAGLGTDTGGSIRYPSAFSNLYGLRPSKGLTSADGVFPLYLSRDTVGPMTRTAEDMAAVLEVIAGTDEKDDFTQEADADALRGDGYLDDCGAEGLEGMRIGILTNSFTYHPDADFYREHGKKAEDFSFEAGANVRDAVNRARENLVKAGAVFVDLSEELTEEDIEALVDLEITDTTAYDMDAYLSGRQAPAYKTVEELLQSGSAEAMEGVVYSYLSFDESEDEDGDEENEEEEESPYDSVTEDGYARLPEWEKILENRETVSKILEEKDVDAVVYLTFLNVPPDYEDAVRGEGFEANAASYSWVFAPILGFPEIMIPMGFSKSTEEYPSELPIGLSLFSDFGGEDALIRLACAYEKQAGSIIRRMPENTPALPDARLNAFLDALMEAAYSIDASGFTGALAGKNRMMENALKKAADADRGDPYAVYEAAAALAETYDSLIEACSQQDN